MSIVPTASLATIGTLSDGKCLSVISMIYEFVEIDSCLKKNADYIVLRDLPLARPGDYSLDIDGEIGNNSDAGGGHDDPAGGGLQSHRLNLFDSQQQADKARELLVAANDTSLIDALARTLAQIDTSKLFV